MNRPPPAVVRAAVAADAPRVSELEDVGLGEDAWSAATVAEALSGATHEGATLTFLVADVDGTVAGYAALDVLADVAELQRIAVAPSYRRSGVGGLLLDAAVTQAHKEGSDRMLLEVRADNAPALSLYADRGFVEIDRRPRYYRDGTAAVVMRLPLRCGCGSAG